MANQPTKYRKFLAGAATASLVATAIVPTALAAEVETSVKDFSDVPATHTHYTNIMQAVERGLFTGYTDGTFKPENTIDRKGVVKSLAKYVVAQSDYKTFEEYITANKLTDTVTPFADVPETHGDAELFNASLIVKSTGIFKGSNNNLMPSNNITRQQMAQVLVNGFGLKDLAGVESEVTDNDKAQAQYVDYINILSENKVTEVTEFNPTGYVKRGQMASFLNRAYDAAHGVVTPAPTPEELSVSAINAKQLVVNFGEEVNVDSVLDGDGELLAGVVLLDGVSLTGEAGEFDEANDSLTITLTTPLVKDTEYSVTVDNVLNLEAEKLPKFSTAFKATESVKPAVKSVTSVTKEEKTNTVNIAFTEPVTFNSIKVNGKFVNFANTDAGFGAKYTLTTSEDLTAGNVYEVEINGLKDGFNNYADNIVKTSVTVQRDTVKPTYTVTSVGEKTIDVKFDKRMSPNVAVDSFTVTYKDQLGNTQTAYQSGLAQLRSDNQTFRITLSAPVFDSASQTSKEVSLAVKNLTDSLGNAVESKTDTVTIVRDTVKPTIKSVKVVPGQHDDVEVEFSEAVTGIAAGDFALTDSNGNTVKTAAGTPVNVSAVSSANTNSSNKVVVTFDANLPASGTYKLVLKQGQLSDTATIVNTNDAQVVAFNYTKPVSAAPQVTATITNDIDGVGPAVTASGSPATRKVVVTFNQSDVVAGLSNSTGSYLEGAADNSANYTINGLALPTGTQVVFADGGVNGAVDYTTDTTDAVVLDFSNVTDANLPTALKAGGSLAVSVANVKTAAGSTLSYTTTTVNVVDTTAPTLSNAFLTGNRTNNTLKLTAQFSEAVTLPGNLSDLNDDLVVTGFKADGTAATISLAALGFVSGSTSQVEFTVTSADLDVTKPIKVHTAGAGNISLTDRATSPNSLAVITAPNAINVTNYASN